METPIISNEKVQVDLTDEILGFSRKAGSVVCALIGVWAVSCLLAGIIRFGVVEMVQGYLTAVTGF